MTNVSNPGTAVQRFTILPAMKRSLKGSLKASGKHCPEVIVIRQTTPNQAFVVSFNRAYDSDHGKNKLIYKSD